MAVTKPDATAFDNANDSIANSRAELYTLATSFNTIADEYNAGSLGGGGSLGTPTVITVTSPGTTVTPTTRYTQILCNSTTGSLTIDMSNQPQDSLWEVVCVQEPGSGTITATFTNPGDSAGDTWTSSPTNITAPFLFEVRYFSHPSSSYNGMYDMNIITIDYELS